MHGFEANVPTMLGEAELDDELTQWIGVAVGSHES